MLNRCNCFEFESYEENYEWLYKKLEKALKEKSRIPEPTLFEESKNNTLSMWSDRC